MPLQFPSEIIVNRFLPAVRTLLAKELHSQNLTQQQIAEKLGVTQAAVSNYLTTDPPVEPRFRNNPALQHTITHIAEGFANETIDSYAALSELLELIHEFEDRGPICELHEEAMPALRGQGCDLCVRLTNNTVTQERTVLTNVRKAARKLADTPITTAYIPNVGTNIGMALPSATDERDIAAIPGRLHAMRGRLYIPSAPEFGASQHVSQIILTAMHNKSNYRGALNLKTDTKLLKVARASGFEPMEFDAEYENRQTRLESQLNDRTEVPVILYHTGAYGIEPITYILGETAIEATDLAITLIEQIDN